MKPRVLIVEDDQAQASILKDIFLSEGYEVILARTASEAESILARESLDLLFTDLKLPGADGLAVLRTAKARAPDLGVILMTAYGTIETAVEAMKEGAADYLLKPFSKHQLLLAARRVLERLQLERERAALQETVRMQWRGGELVGRSAAMQQVFRLIKQVAPSASTVLITGETGTGKELVARAIHDLSPRRDHPFLPLNCSAVPEGLMESELFGHERGAFTGAHDRRLGKVALAHQGTLFLDEVGDMPLTMQAKLLRTIQFGEFQMLGSAQVTRVDVRVIAATHKNLASEVQRGAFREDLWYRLNVMPITLPPLRERLEDVPDLARHYLAKLERERKRTFQLSPEALKLLSQYRYPGNVRELENILERATILCEGEIIRPAHLWFGGRAVGPTPAHLGEVKHQAVEIAERQAIVEALEATGWNRVQAAKRLKVDYKTLRRKIARYRLHPKATPGFGPDGPEA